MVRFQPATALLGFIYADPLKLSTAQKVRREEVLDADSKSNEIIANLVLDAEFHRAMLQTGAAAQEMVNAGRTGKLLQRMRKRRAGVMMRRRRDLAAASSSGGDGGDGAGRSVGTARTVGAEGADMTKAAEECVPEDPVVDSEEADVGALTAFSFPHDSAGMSSSLAAAKCRVGYVCEPTAASTLGGRCVPPSSTQRTLEDLTTTYDCPAGCPPKVCECFLEDSAYDPTCYDALISSCNDGSYIGSCAGSDPLYQAYATVGCASYTCLDRKGLFDPAADYNCDLTNPDCGACYCEYYASVCDTFAPICSAGAAAGSADSYFCYDLDYVCAKKECCARYGPESCLLDLYDTVQPNPAPLIPIGGGGGGGDGLPTEGGGTTTSTATGAAVGPASSFRLAAVGAAAAFAVPMVNALF